MSRDPYYDLDLISASRLGIVKSIRDGTPIFKVKKETLDFGKQFHEAILEPEKYKLKLEAAMAMPYKSPEHDSYKANRFKIASMAQAARKNAILMNLLNQPDVKVEHNHFFDEASYGEKVKIKMDAWSEQLGIIADPKTTAAKTYADFYDTITKYGYHQQGALYIDGTNAKTFILVGVSKSHPHNTFTVPLNWDCELIQDGRAEYEDLITYYLGMPEKPDFKLLMQ